MKNKNNENLEILEELKKTEAEVLKAKMQDCFSLINLGKMPNNNCDNLTFNVKQGDVEIMSCCFNFKNFSQRMLKQYSSLTEEDLLFVSPETEILFKTAYLQKHLKETIEDSIQQLLNESDLLHQHYHLFNEESKMDPKFIRKELIKSIEKKIFKRLNVKTKGGSNKKFSIENPLHLEQLAEKYLFFKNKFENLKRDLSRYNNIKGLNSIEKDPSRHDHNLAKFMVEVTDETIPGYISCDALIRIHKLKNVTPDTLYRSDTLMQMARYG